MVSSTTRKNKASEKPDIDIESLIEPERVHRTVFTDPDIFEMEMDKVFTPNWNYVGHESQVPNAGDYFTTQVARQPVVMSRHTDGEIYVLENRCPHRAAMVCPDRNGSNEKFMCMYHGWRFNSDGTLASVPAHSGYDDTGFDVTDPKNGMKQLPRVVNYRGFVFASLNPDVEDFETWAGDGLRGFANAVDRAPEGELEVVGDCYRTVQNNNWKIFVDNMFDGMHTSFVHHQSARAAVRTIAKFEAERAAGGLAVTALLAGPPDQMAKMKIVAFPNGHVDMSGFASQPVEEEYMDAMVKGWGKEKAEDILGRNYHNCLLFPTVVLQPTFQQLRVIRPISADKTLLEIWTFRLKGAPKSYLRRAITFSNVANSPSNIVAADDFEAYYRVHEGLKGPESDWILLHRDAGKDVPEEDGSLRSYTGNSEIAPRAYYQAWRDYMTAE